MNDTIEAHEHMEDLDHHSFCSMVVWIIFAIIIIFLIAFTLYIFHYLYYIRSTIYSVLKTQIPQSPIYFYFHFPLRPNLKSSPYPKPPYLSHFLNKGEIS
jgi:hypothetical protein